jgi:signal transduction histidine kinase/ligand-binding sensor domain-containing protein
LNRIRTHWIVLACALLSGPRAFALNPSLDISQYAHTAWKVRDGFSKGRITSVAQTPDGYLWLGTEFGLLRFDGVRNVPWQPPAGQQLPNSFIRYLLTARDGRLWIGTIKGLASWKDGTLSQYAELAGQSVDTLLEDREGTLWAGTQAIPAGSLCAIRRGHAQCYGSDGSVGRGVGSLYEDSKGNLWVLAETGLWRWRPGPPKHYSLPDVRFSTSQMLNEGDSGALLIATNNGVKQFIDKKIRAFPLSTGQQFTPHKLFRDRDGGLWIGTGKGLAHVHKGRTDLFARSDGLSGDFINRFFEDREGNVWVVTNDGLDRFREFAVATLSAGAGASSVLATTDGSVWIGALDGLYRWADQHMIVDSGLPKKAFESLLQDDRGRIWVSTQAGVGYLENDRFIAAIGGSGLTIRSIVEDSQGNLWIANQNLGLVQLRRNGEVQQSPWTRLGHQDFASALAASPSGGLWVGFMQGGVSYLADGQVRVSYAARDGLGEGRVNAFHVDRDGTLWAATPGGLSRLKSSHVTTLTSRHGLPCDEVNWAIEDDSNSFWLDTACGIVRIARPELDAWSADADKGRDPKRAIHVTVFDSSDGVRSKAIPVSAYSPAVAKSRDGRLWFATEDGVGVVDPRHLPLNTLPPPVQIEQITADRKTYDATSTASGLVGLPPLVRDLQINYTALSLVAPEKNRFRVKLESWDRDWQDVGTRRQAFYSNLPPRNYRFRVSASNNSGVWNEAGASLDFSIAPAYYQTLWFRLSVVAAFLSLLGALYQLRQRQLVRQFNMRLEERVSERTLIARDLHDTLLQSFHGVVLRFQAAALLLPDRPADAQKALASGIDQAAEALAEGRDAVQGLRSSVGTSTDLASLMSGIGEELAADRTDRQAIDLRVQVEGTPRDLGPLTQDEVYRIAREALRNAYRHAHATRIVIEIRYDARQFRLRVRDDGKGMDQKVVDGGGREGHYGLAGMRERAKGMRGTLTIWSELDSGTEVELTIPGLVAYAKPSETRPSAASEAI